MRLLVAVGLIGVVGCGSGPAPERVESRRVVGDTVWVVAEGDGVWSTGATATIDHRIGSVDADEGPTFGRIAEVAATPDGGAVVHDIFYNRVYRVSAEGGFVGEIGSPGQGPGQFDGVGGLTAARGGTVFVRSMDDRILAFDSAGVALHEWRMDERLAGVDPLTAIGDSLLAVKVVRGGPSARRETAFLLLTPAGDLVDSLGPVSTPWDDEVRPGQSDIMPTRHTAFSPAGFAVAGVGSRLALEIRERSGSVVRIERGADPVGFLVEERADWEAQNAFLRQRSGAPERFPPVPESKPVFRGLFTGPDGSVWVQRSAPALGPDPGHVAEIAGLRTTPEWLEPLVVDVFARDGSYLGRVRGPVGIRLRAVGDGILWGVANGTLGEPLLVRLEVRR